MSQADVSHGFWVQPREPLEGSIFPSEFTPDIKKGGGDRPKSGGRGGLADLARSELTERLVESQPLSHSAQEVNPREVAVVSVEVRQASSME